VLAVQLGGGVAMAWGLQGAGRLVVSLALMRRFGAGAWKTSRL